MEKWVINVENVEEDCKVGKKEDWDENYQKFQYEDVWSITEDIEVCKKLTTRINEDSKKILIPGCGSKTHLQDYINAIYNNVEIFCTDWSRYALEIAKGSKNENNAYYLIDDMTEMQFESDTFDNIIISNSILSGNDKQNRKMVGECYRVLKEGGILSGLFPSIFSIYEISYLDNRFEYLRKDGIINIENNTFYEKTQGLHQIFYTPIRLRRIFEENKFRIDKFELFFCNTEHLLKENERIYNIPRESDLVPWEFFLELRKEGENV